MGRAQANSLKLPPGAVIHGGLTLERAAAPVIWPAARVLGRVQSQHEEGDQERIWANWLWR